MKKWKHLFKAALISAVIAMTAVQVCSAAEAGVQNGAAAEVSVLTNEIPGWPPGPGITSETGVLMDADSGVLLYNKGGDEIRYPASITKIMTLLLAVENSSLTEDVTLYLLAEDGSEDATLNELLTRYADLSSHIKYEKKDPVLNPSFASSYTDEDLASNSVIVVSDKRSKVIPYSDLYESSVNYQTYSMETTAFDGEGQVTSAIAYVTTEDLPILYTLTGHEENDLDSSMQSAIEKENIEVQELNLLTAGTVPEDASCLMINAPQKDFSDDETSAILTYLQNGGHAFLVSGYTTTEMPNYHSILEQYGVSIEKGVVLEGDNNHYVSGNPLYLVPEIQSCDATGSLSGSNSYVLMPIGQSIKTLDSKSDDITVTDMLSSTSSAYLKADPENMESLSKEENDESGPFTLAAAITEAIGSGSDSEEETETETIVEGESSASQVEAESETEAAEDAKETRLVVLASSQFLTSNTDSAVSGGNTKLLTNALSWMCGQSSSISIPSKSMQLSYLTLTSANVNLWSIITIAVLPVLFLVTGGVIWLKRRKK